MAKNKKPYFANKGDLFFLKPLCYSTFPLDIFIQYGSNKKYWIPPAEFLKRTRYEHFMFLGNSKRFFCYNRRLRIITFKFLVNGKIVNIVAQSGWFFEALSKKPTKYKSLWAEIVVK